MSLSRHLPRRIPSGSAVFRPFSTVSSPAHRPQHEFVPPNPYINSWKTPQNPKEAAKQLALLRRDYDRKVKEIRKDYINEMEMVRLEKLRKDEARKEALRIAKEERAAAKAAKKKADATDRHAAEQEFRQMLMKERAEKLEYWRMRQNKIQEKKKEKNDLLRRESSNWVDESELKVATDSVLGKVPSDFQFAK